MRCKTFLVAIAVLSAIPFVRAVEKLADGLYAEFTTPRGVFVAELYYEKAPMTVANFVGLAEGAIAPREGRPFYSDLKWFRVVPGFVIQGGDPDHYVHRDTDLDSAPHTFPDEFVPGLRHDAPGVLSMANAGPDTNTTQFFVTLADATRLNYLHSVFGRVVRGLEVPEKIQADDDFRIRIIRVGPAAKAFQADEPAFKALVARAETYQGQPEPGPTAHFDDPDGLLPTEPPRARGFNFKLANFSRTTGVKVVARLAAKSPSAAEDAEPGAYMRGQATQFGVERRGVFVAYFADEKDWRIWIGDDLIPAFLGRAATAEDTKDGGALHEAKMALIEKAQADGDAAFAAQQKAPPGGRPVPATQQLKLQTDALLDALLLRLEPKS